MEKARCGHRRIIGVLAAVSLLLMAAALFVSGTAQEAYYSWRLKSHSPEGFEEGARGLAAMGSMKLLPVLADLEAGHLQVTDGDWYEEFLEKFRGPIVRRLLEMWPRASLGRRVGIAKLLEKIDAAKEPAVRDYFMRLLREGDRRNPEIVVGILAGLCSEDAGVRSALVELLSAEREETRTEVVFGFRHAGNHAELIRPLLRERFNVETSSQVRSAILMVYSGLANGHMEVDFLLGALGDPARVVRALAAQLLGTAALPSLHSIRGLVGALNDVDGAVRNSAIRSLGRIGADAAVAVEDLLGVLEAGTPAERELAAEALGKIGVKTEAVLKALRKASQDEDRGIASAAVTAIERLQSTPEAATNQ